MICRTFSSIITIKLNQIELEQAVLEYVENRIDVPVGDHRVFFDTEEARAVATINFKGKQNNA